MSEALHHRNYKPVADLFAVAWMDFYKTIRIQVAMFNVALMPFESTHIRYKLHGMCYPGLSIRRYSKMGSVLLMILDQILAKDFRLVMEMIKRAHHSREN